MNDAKSKSSSNSKSGGLPAPLALVLWPIITPIKWFLVNFAAYIVGRTVRDSRRVYSIKFVWYGDSVYLHPMVWGSLVIYLLAASTTIAGGWLLLVWFIMLFACILTVMYDFDIIKAAVFGLFVLALMGGAYFSQQELSWNPLLAVSNHIHYLEASVTPGFYITASYVFGALIICEVVWAWLFHRVEIDESYVYEHQFLKGTIREPIFARGLKRETKDLMELLILGAADIQHRTKNGYKRFRNVPFASLWLGTAIDSMLDFRRKGQIDMEEEQMHDDAEDVRVEDALGDDDADDDDVH